MIYRARIVVPMDGPPIEDGAVAVRGNQIQAVGRFKEVSKLYPRKVTDLGERVLMPGLINAHCHLDYTLLWRTIQPDGFTQWIQRINALKRTLDEEDYLESISRGFDESKKWGTTTVLNIESFPELMSEIPPPPIRTWWFYELIDIRQRIATEEVVAGAFVFFQERPDWLGGFGLSPHAPYTASPGLYRLANDCARVTGMPLTTHVAESAEEDAMFREASGPLYDFMAGLGRDMSDCGRGSSLGNLVRNGLIDENWIIAHLNELTEDDFHLLESVKFSVVHCPLSHRYFQHRPFQFKRLHDLGMNLCLGTDSLASNDSLNLFSEMRTVQHFEPWITPEELLKTVTVNPALALNRSGKLGCIAPGAHADLIALQVAADAAGVYEAIIQNRHPVEWMLVDGGKV